MINLDIVEFKNLPDKTTKINAQNLNKIQENTDNALKKVQNVMNEKFNSVFYQNEVTGENINIKDALDYKIEKVTVDGKSVQASTTGKNKLAYSLEEIKNTNTVGVWNNNVYTYNGVTFKVNDDLSIEIGGTFNDRAYLYLQSNSRSIIDKGTYILSGTPKGGSTSSYMMIVGINDGTEGKGNVLDIGNGNTLDTTSYTNSTIRTYIDIRSSAGLNKTFYPMLRLSSVDDSTYEPYTGGEPSPNPNYPQNINSITGDVLLNITGKNLLKLKDGTYTSNGLTLTIENNILTLNGTNNGTESVFDAIKSSVSVPTTSKTKIKSFQIDGTCTNTSETYFRSYVGWTNGINLNFTTSTIKNLNANLVYNNFTIGIKSGTFNNYRFRILIANDLTDNTTYEPYQSNSITIDLQGNELCSIGDIKDELAIENGNVKILKKIGKKNFNGTETQWEIKSPTTDNFIFQIPVANINELPSTLSIGQVISNYFIKTSPSIIWQNDINGITNLNNAKYIRVRFKGNPYKTLNEFKTWLSTNNVTIYYVLETSQEIDLGSLSEENIEKLKTFAGSNNIIVNASLDTNVSIKYGLDLKKYIDNKIENLSNS